MAFPLSKLFCILSATLGLHVASTSPNPPLRQSERTIAPTKIEFMLACYNLRIIQTTLYWVIAIAESVVTLAQLAPPSFWADRILLVLTMGGNIKNVDPFPTPTLVLGALLIICGACLRFECYRALGSHFTFETGLLKDHKLITSGPYSIVRHPGYSGASLAGAGLLLYYGSAGSWAMECLIQGSILGRVFGLFYALLMCFVVAGLISRVPKEDQALKNEFGEEWEKWAADHYALIPGVY